MHWTSAGNRLPPIGEAVLVLSLSDGIGMARRVDRFLGSGWYWLNKKVNSSSAIDDVEFWMRIQRPEQAGGMGGL